MTKRDSGKIIVNVFRGHRRLLWAVFAVAFFTSVIIQTLMAFFIAMTRRQNGIVDDSCGLYDVMIEGLNQHQAEAIAKQMESRTFLTISYECKNGVDGPYQLFNAGKELIDFLPYRIYAGEYPVCEDEILAEAWWVRKNISAKPENLIGSTVYIGTKAYVVSGLICYTGNSVSDDQPIVIISGEASRTNAVLLAMEGNQKETDYEAYKEFLDGQLDEDTLVSFNWEKVWASEGNSQSDIPVLLWVVSVIAVASLIILISVSSFYALKCGMNAHTLMDIGVGERRIRRALFRVIEEQIAFGSWLGFFVSMIWNRIFYVWSTKGNANWGTFIAEELAAFLVVFFLQSGVVFFVIERKKGLFTREIYIKARRTNKQVSMKNPYLLLSLRNLRSNGFVTLLFVLGFSIAASAVIAFSTYSECLTLGLVDYSDISFRLSLDNNRGNQEKNIEQIKEVKKRILSDPYLSAEDGTLYFFEMSIDKNLLTDEMKAFVVKYGRGRFALQNSLTRQVNIPVVLMSFEALGMRESDVSEESDGLIINRLNQRADYKVLHESNNPVQGILSGGQTILCDVCDVHVKNLHDNSAVMVISLKDEILSTIIGDSLNCLMYCKGDVSVDYLYSVIGDDELFRVESGEELSQINEAGLRTIRWLLGALLLVCGCALLLSYGIVNRIRLILRTREYQTLSDIGISHRKIRRIVFYENALVCVSTCVLILALSMGFHCLIAERMSRRFQLTGVPYPWKDYLKVCIPLSIAVLLIQYRNRQEV